jgi:hypothetical protein
MVDVPEQQQMQNNAFWKNNPRKNYYIENEESKVWLDKTEIEKDL